MLSGLHEMLFGAFHSSLLSSIVFIQVPSHTLDYIVPRSVTSRSARFALFHNLHPDQVTYNANFRISSGGTVVSLHVAWLFSSIHDKFASRISSFSSPLHEKCIALANKSRHTFPSLYLCLERISRHLLSLAVPSLLLRTLIKYSYTVPFILLTYIPLF